MRTFDSQKIEKLRREVGKTGSPVKIAYPGGASLVIARIDDTTNYNDFAWERVNQDGTVATRQPVGTHDLDLAGSSSTVSR